MSGDAGDLNHVLGQFERVASNLEKLEEVWATLPTADLAAHENLVRSFVNLLPGLPPIDGFTIESIPMGKTEAELLRFDAGAVGEPEAWVHAEEAIDAPGREIAEYRFRLDRARKKIVRERVMEVVAGIDALVGPTGRLAATEPLADDWDHLGSLVAELERLVATVVPRHARWGDLRRHIHFASDVDLRDIIQWDWPSVRAEVDQNLYDDSEPLPVAVDDLGEMVRARPTGPVSTQLAWDKLSAEQFESVIYEIVRTAEGYENTNWLMRTNAPDRGRDIETHRVVADVLSGTVRARVIVQCKHWLTKSIAVKDFAECLATVSLWEPPPIDVLIVATSGRFTQDAVAWYEKRRLGREQPTVELWPESHIETLIARRPSIAARFGLR